jgi:hypothetical protein
MKKIILTMFLLVLINLASATTCDDSCGSCLGVFKQGNIISLKQTCDNCTYVNVSSVTDPESKINKIEGKMTKNGIDYNYSYTGTHKIGDYIYTVYGDKNGVLISEDICFKITPSGSSGTETLFIILIILTYGVAFVGFFGKNEWVTLFGALSMMILGIYITTNGIIVYRDFLTKAISYFTIGLGAFFALFTTLTLINENY